MERCFVYTVILCARSLCIQGRPICRLASYAGSSSSDNFFLPWPNNPSGQGLLVIKDS